MGSVPPFQCGLGGDSRLDPGVNDDEVRPGASLHRPGFDRSTSAGARPRLGSVHTAAYPKTVDVFTHHTLPDFIRDRGGVSLRPGDGFIPYQAIKEGDFTLPKEDKMDIFADRIVEVEGFPGMKCGQAFELSDASAERSDAGCTIKLSKVTIAEFMASDVTMLRWMIAEGYGDVRSLKRRIA